MKKFPKCLVGLVTVVFIVTAYASGPKVREVASSSSKYIEVCRNGIVYLPPETKFVTCHGRVMRVIAIVSLEGKAEATPEDCDCPRCCNGACAITVSCGGGGLCVAYLAC